MINHDFINFMKQSVIALSSPMLRMTSTSSSLFMLPYYGFQIIDPAIMTPIITTDTDTTLLIVTCLHESMIHPASGTDNQMVWTLGNMYVHTVALGLVPLTQDDPDPDPRPTPRSPTLLESRPWTKPVHPRNHHQPEPFFTSSKALERGPPWGSTVPDVRWKVACA